MRSTFFSLLSLLATAAPALAMTKKTYNLTVDDFSPLLVYDPPVQQAPLGAETYAFPSSPSSWNCSFTASSWQKWNVFTVGGGSSYHTGPKGAKVSVTWEGTGITINGQRGLWNDDPAPNGEATLTVDGKAGSCGYPDSGDEYYIQCSLQGLDSGKHTAVLTVTSGHVAIGEVQFTSDFISDLADTSKAAIETWNTNESGQINPNIKTSGYTPISQLNDGRADPYARIFANTSGAYAQVTTPPKTSMVQIIGLVDVDHRNFSVEVTPAPPGGDSKFFGSAYNPWTTIEQTLFATSLDPNTQYTVKFTHLEENPFPASIYSDLASFKFIKATDTTSSGSSGISAGAIAGIVVGVVLGLAIIGALVWFFFFHKKKKQSYDSHPLRGTIDDYEPVYGPQPTPLNVPAGSGSQPLMGYANAPSVSGMTSSSGTRDPWDGADTASITTAGMAGFGAGQGSRDSYLTPPVPLTKAQLARQSENGGRGPMRHVIQQHADAGSVVSPDADTVVEEVPPSYNPEWASSGPSEAGMSRSSMLSPGRTSHID